MLKVTNPYSLEEIASLPMHHASAAEEILAHACHLYKDRPNWLPAYRRIEILEKAAQLISERQEELAYQIANEGGKPLSDARVEMSRAIEGVKLAAKELLHYSGEEIPMDLSRSGSGHRAFTTKEPIGPVVAVSAFNHPFNLIVHQAAPAIAVGAPVIVKPARATPLSARSFVEIMQEAGLPEAWCQFILCDNETTEKLVTDPRTAFMIFIGSEKIGWSLRNKLAAGTRCAMEHGGVAPVIIDETADLDAILPKLVKGGFYHAGQVCVSIQKIFAPASIAHNLAERLAEQSRKLRLGNATNEKTDIGPLIDPKEVERIDEWVQEAIDSGAETYCGAEKMGKTTYAPTVLLNPSPNARLSTEEIFGPVIGVYSYDDVQEALDRINELPYAFQASCFTQKIDLAWKVVRNLEAATVLINEQTAFRVDWMPFAGHQRSGHGTGGIRYTMEDMSYDKLIIFGE